MRCIIQLLFSGALVVAAGCGASDEPPKPLSAHYDEANIGMVDVNQRQPEFAAQQDWNVARAQNMQADAQVKDAQQKLGIARNDAKAVHLGVDSAKTTKQSADMSNDTNRINDAAKQLNTATDLAKAADARVHYLEVYVHYMERYLRWTQENMYFREAQFENAKATIGQRNNIAPKGVVYDSFPKQMQDREHRTAAAKSTYEGQRQPTEGARDNWLKLQTQADSENGKPGTYWDPLAPQAGPAVP